MFKQKIKYSARTKRATRAQFFLKNKSKYGSRNFKVEDDTLYFLRSPWDANSRRTNRHFSQGGIFYENVYFPSLDWKSLRSVKTCLCTMPFDHFTKKYHCWQCGHVFCVRCIERHVSLPGHLSQCAVPVCQPCYQKITCYSPCYPT